MDSFNRKAPIYKEQLPTEQLFLYAKSIKKELFLLELFIVDRRFSVKAVQLILWFFITIIQNTVPVNYKPLVEFSCFKMLKLIEKCSVNFEKEISSFTITKNSVYKVLL